MRSRLRGGDANIGGRLPSLLRATGLVDPQMNVVQTRSGFEGEVKMIAPITLEAIADAVLAAGLCTVPDLESDGRSTSTPSPPLTAVSCAPRASCRSGAESSSAQQQRRGLRHNQR